MNTPPLILNVHTPVSSFSIVHSNDDTLEELFHKLSNKAFADINHQRIRPGWVKYSWNGSIWNLDDDSDYIIFTWRMKSAEPESDHWPVLYVRNPDEPLPDPSAYRNPSFYMFRPRSPPPSLRARSINGSIHSGKKGRKTPEEVKPQEVTPKYKQEFEKFHSENGVRTVLGSIGPVENVRMLLKSGYRHVYISRKFAIKHGFIPADAAPGHYGYGGLVNIGKWPVVVGHTKTMHTVYLSEESHFDVVLGRSFMEARQVKLDPVDPTDVVCMDTGEKIDCELVILKDGKGQIVTVT
ncbi:uncharacterized protein LAESUDRAFT_695311 [Laetiporus sulphureus 93-53]|uniref:Uncharacterized protein n=1 Tax=Laetiporus sulphureus 93-53 TaxID=1314785 RepID=A0A165FZL2_9APHY|nr:uncharacterized protein LAESUDRAFT_695311 [Laetiporus sulphureus 93-53]KZT09626.1 hypothetical protein LAESUDRAFT_695311 [Laetiporus sulphureus 93-53]